jgi:signal transduction histidine kinase
MLFAIASVLILGTGYFTSQYLARDLQGHLQTETNRLAYSRVLLSTRLLGEAVLKNDYAEIKQVIDGLSDDSEISCVQYRDGKTLISSQASNEPCQPLTDEGLFSMTLSEEHSHEGDAHTGETEPAVEKKVLEVAVKGEYSRRMSEKVKYPFLILGVEFIAALLILGLYFSLSSRALSQFLVRSFRKIALGEKVETPRSILLEGKPIEQSLAEIERNLLEYQRLVSERVESETLVKVAAQISHDVRAPLGAMELIVGSLNSVSNEQREILKVSMKRIRDISDSLLSKQSQIKGFVSTTTVQAMAQSIEPLKEMIPSVTVTEILREKELIKPATIRFHWHPLYQEAVVKLQPTEWARMLSNLFNNAMESMAARGGDITVTESLDTMYILSIQDQGSGISSEDLDRIGTFGVTIGKTEGKGIGLHHAIQTVRSWGGDLRIESKVGEGTLVRLMIPVHSSEAMNAVGVSWKQKRVIALGLKEKELQEVRAQSEFIYAFDSIDEFRKYYGQNFADLDQVVFVLHSSASDHGWNTLVQELGLSSQVSYFS